MATELLRLLERLCRPISVAEGIHPLIRWLAVILAADYLSGVLCALLGKAKHGKTLSSRIGFLGIVRKSLVFVVVGVAYLVDQALRANAFCEITIRGFIINEAISTLQNVSSIGTWVPAVLKNGLSRAKETIDPSGNDTQQAKRKQE